MMETASSNVLSGISAIVPPGWSPLLFNVPENLPAVNPLLMSPVKPTITQSTLPISTQISIATRSTGAVAMSLPATTATNVSQVYVAPQPITLHTSDPAMDEAIYTVLALEQENDKKLAELMDENRLQAEKNENTRLELERQRAELVEKDRLLKEQEDWQNAENARIEEQARIRLEIENWMSKIELIKKRKSKISQFGNRKPKIRKNRCGKSPISEFSN